MRFRIGLDVGGTFTDLFLVDEVSGRTFQHKLPSTPEQPDLAPLRGIREILAMAGASAGEVAFIGLGTTVMTNALLERKGATTALITTEGFRDLLEIARQTRPHTFDPFTSKPPPLVPRQLRIEVAERIAADGTVLTVLDKESLQHAIERVLDEKVQAIAICFLNSYSNPAHERAVADVLRRRWPAGHISVSFDVLPEFREYERLSSTVINAYLMPATRDYVRRFEAEVACLGVPQAPFIMNSGGGIMTADQAGERPIDTLFSGPSGGVSGAIDVATRAGHRDIITFDMGGTSTDVCLIQNGTPQLTHARTVSGYPLKAAALDVHTVGAGGSSIASIDAGGMLQVGPHSAGAHPGPACYGRGGELPTVTDANLVLGRLNPEFLLGGALPIDPVKSHAAVDKHIARPKGIDPVEAAASILAIADTNMAQAVRFVSVERGLDPKDFVLVAFGGAGPLHAASIARELGVAGVLVPYSAGVLCAMGVLTKDMQMDFSRTRIVAESAADCCAIVNALYGELESRALKEFSWEGSDGNLLIQRSADVRYAGQNHELSVCVPDGVIDASSLAIIKENLHRAHEQLYGYRSPEHALELVTCRVKAARRIPRPDLTHHAAQPRTGALKPIASREAFFDMDHGFIKCPIYDRAHFRAADALAGPAIIEQMDATTLIPPGFRAHVDATLNLFLTVDAEAASSLPRASARKVA